MESEHQLIFTDQESKILLEALEDMLYKIAMDMDKLKGGPMSVERRTLDEKQKVVEQLQHKVSLS